MLLFSIPALYSLHQKNQVQVIQDDIKSAIRFGTSEALISGNNLILTPLKNSNDWSDGILLFVDNTKHRYTPDVKLLREWRWQSPNVRVIWQGFQSNNYLLFSSDISQNAMNGYFEISSKTQQPVKLVINRLGRVRLAQSTSTTHTSYS